MSQVKVGRPSKFNREAAVNVVKDAFWQQGYNALSVNQLASLMGITRSSLYNSFGDKPALFQEALACYNSNTPITLLEQLPENAPVVPAINAFFREVCRTRVQDQGNQGCMMVNAVSELVGSDESLSGSVEALVVESIDLFEMLLQRALDRGEITRSGDLRATASALVAFLMGFNNLTKVVRDEAQLWNICLTFLRSYQFSEVH